MVEGWRPNDSTGIGINRRVFFSGILGVELLVFLILYLTALSPYQPEALILLDEKPVNNAIVEIGNYNFTVNGGHFYISGTNMYSWFRVTIEGQTFNLSIPEGDPFYLWRFYHCDLIVFDSEGNRIGNFMLYLNGMSMGQSSRVIVPYGESLLKIATRNAEYSLKINISAPSRVSITLPVSDLEILLTSKDGFPIKNQTLKLKFEDSSECLLTTDDRGFARLNSAPHGAYTIGVLGQEMSFIHNSSIKKRFTIDVVEKVSILVENAYLLFPTRVSVKLFSFNGRPSINSLVTLECEGMEYRGFTDSNGEVAFYLPPSLFMCSNLTVSTCGLMNYTKIYRNPAPIVLFGLMMGALAFYVSKSRLWKTC
ncbi:MAG: hypothetical protein N3D12_01515 [Candidatus Methanomethyliaceae archaeon]|nr:hypothetical protein [Candidatus Methanomethyliaceae archaeon]